MNSKAKKQVPWDKDFYFVPGFTRYGISEEGVLKNLASNKTISWVISKPNEERNLKNITGGYRVANIYDDEGVRRGVSRHRLLCLIFKPCPGDPEKYTVNHEDGVPGNDWLSNLKWATYSQNNQHAYDNGLRPNGTKPVILRYWRTGEELKFPTIQKCCEYINRSHNFLYSRLSRNSGVAYDDGLQIKFEGDNWVSVDDRVAKERFTRSCAAKHMETGRIFIDSSARSLALSLNLNPHTVARIVSKGLDYSHKGFYFREVKSGTKWPDGTSVKQ